jgi:hypothetical protein
MLSPLTRVRMLPASTVSPSIARIWSPSLTSPCANAWLPGTTLTTSHGDTCIQAAGVSDTPLAARGLPGSLPYPDLARIEPDADAQRALVVGLAALQQLLQLLDVLPHLVSHQPRLPDAPSSSVSAFSAFPPGQKDPRASGSRLSTPPSPPPLPHSVRPYTVTLMWPRRS